MAEPSDEDMDLYMRFEQKNHARLNAQDDSAQDQQAELLIGRLQVHFFEPGAAGMNLSLRGSTAASSISELFHVVA